MTQDDISTKEYKLSLLCSVETLEKAWSSDPTQTAKVSNSMRETDTFHK